MSLTISSKLLLATTCEALQDDRKYADNMRNEREWVVQLDRMSAADLEDVQQAATKLKDTKTARAAEAILIARKGTFNKPVPNFKAFQGVLVAFLKSNLIDGWLYVTGPDGKLYPELVTNVTYEDASLHRGNGTPTVRIHTASYGCANDNNRQHQFGNQTQTHHFHPADVVNRRIADILGAKNILKETPALRAAYDESMARHRKVTQTAFAKQFRVSGPAYQYGEDNWRRRGEKLSNRRVIHDLDAADFGAVQAFVESSLFEETTKEGVGAIPEHPLVRVFDLKSHEFYWVHGDHMTPYKYDKSLRDKLILPDTHRDLLDVLTTDLDAFIDDIIEGKSAGNVILCKGIAGIGKTLTAEVYAELIERPLYSIHSGNLGTTAEEVEKNLQTVFQRSKRWACPLLLDEADVFVVRRGNNIEQNAIVAEFLRTLEYFDGLLFMTTNRPDDIDEAIISRCAAIVDYTVPEGEATAAIWRVQANQHKVALKDSMVRDLVKLFPQIAPRDIKMLFRLALRVAKSRKEPLSIEMFRRCAMFRAIKMAGRKAA